MYSLKYFNLLRVGFEFEEQGADIVYHGGISIQVNLEELDFLRNKLEAIRVKFDKKDKELKKNLKNIEIEQIKMKKNFVKRKIILSTIEMKLKNWFGYQNSHSQEKKMNLKTKLEILRKIINLIFKQDILI